MIRSSLAGSMAVLRVTLVQKNPANPPTEDLRKRLAQEKTDFILLSGPGGDSNSALDWLHRLSDSSPAIVMGGLFRSPDGTTGCPVLLDGALIDTIPEIMEATEPVLILKGQRFATLPGKSALSEDNFKNLEEQKIRLVFCPVLAAADDPVQSPDHFQKMARDNMMVIAKCAGCGRWDGKELAGQSFIAAPSGISWRVSEQEYQREIIKTLAVQPPAE